MDRDEQIKIVKRLRERFEDDVYDLLDRWVDALDEAQTGDEWPGEPLMDEYTRVFKVKDFNHEKRILGYRNNPSCNVLNSLLAY